jgi:hypothetical protein
MKPNDITAAGNDLDALAAEYGVHRHNGMYLNADGDWVSDVCAAGRCGNCWDDACGCPMCGHSGD